MNYKYSCEKLHERTTIYSGDEKHILNISDVEGCCDRTRSIIALCAKKIGESNDKLSYCRVLFLSHEFTDLNNYIEDEFYEWDRHLKVLDQRLSIFTGAERNLIVNLMEMDVLYSNDYLEYKPFVHDFLTKVYPKLIHKDPSLSEIDYSDDQLRSTIDRYLSFLKGTYYRNGRDIMNEDDYQRLIEWTFSYFSNNFKVPIIDYPIESEHFNCSNGNIVHTYHILFKKLFPNMTRPDSLYELLRGVFRQLSTAKITNLKKMNKPQYYDQQNPLRD